MQANFLGLPALAVPVGTVESQSGSGRKLPVSLQLMARPWHEASLLRVGCLLEAVLKVDGRSPVLPVLLMDNVCGKAAAVNGKA